MKHVFGWVFIVMLSVSSATAQDTDSLFYKADSLFTSADSLSIFNLIDSLLSAEDLLSSQLAVRLSYNSNVLSAGRTLGIENFGLSPGVSYYHKSGMYADVSGYWSKDFVPAYYLTVASLGYMRDFSRHFSIMAGYDRYFYHLNQEDNYIPYRNTLSISPIVEFKPITLSLSYSFYFGDQYAHRIMPGIGFQLQKKKLLKIDRISISPAFYPLWGNEVITEFEIIPPQTFREALDNYAQYGTRYKVEQHDRDVFGIMNYAITVPLIVSHKKWGFSFTYTYNIPRALPGEPDVLSESSFLSGSITRFIDLASK